MTPPSGEWVDPALEPLWDNDPTEVGYEWCCNGCTLRTISRDEAVSHLIEQRDHGSFPHMMFERRGGNLEERARRRMCIYPGGTIQSERIRAPERSTSGKGSK